MWVSEQQHNCWLQDILLANQITNSGCPNKLGCHIPLVTKWNTKLFDAFLLDYEDRDITDWLTYGFSISRDDGFQDPTPAVTNHRGATMFPQSIADYIETEIRLGAIYYSTIFTQNRCVAIVH